MHSMGCQRNNIWCPECQHTIPKKEQEFHVHCPICKVALNKLDLEKHTEFYHGNVICECGIELPREVLDLHKQNDCMQRIVSCKFCDTKLPFVQKQDHEQLCGARSIPCEICNELVPRRKMDIHRAAIHRINPCFTGSSTEVRSNLGLDGNLNDFGLSEEELQYLKAIENTADSASNMNAEDAILAQVLSRSAQEANALGKSSHSSVYDDVIVIDPEIPHEELKDAGDDGSLWNESTSDVEMLESTECPVCGEQFPRNQIEAHFAQEHAEMI
jgi:hypothetical protein